MQTALIKKLTLVVVIASTYAITGCSDANSKNPVSAQNSAQPAEAVNTSTGSATTSVTPTQTSEETKRDAESGNALY